MEDVDPVVAALIGDIYDASLDRALWPGVFESVCSYVGGRRATSEARDKVWRFVDLHLNWEIHDRYLERIRTRASSTMKCVGVSKSSCRTCVVRC